MTPQQKRDAVALLEQWIREHDKIEHLAFECTVMMAAAYVLNADVANCEAQFT